MRTTLVLPDPVFERAKDAARGSGCTLSQYVTRALATLMSHEDDLRTQHRPTFHVEPENMGVPTVDLADREQLYRRMEE